MPDFIAERQTSDKREKILRLSHVRQNNNARENKNVNQGDNFYSRGHKF
jgi:hypothetical protein